MKHLRVYLFAPNDEGIMVCTPFRDLEPLLDAVAKIVPQAAAIHVGFWRPETAAVADLLRSWPNSLLVSESSWTVFPLDMDVRISSQPAGFCEGLNFHVANHGFGYSAPNVGNLPAQPLLDLPTTTSSHSRPAADFRDWVAEVVAMNMSLRSALSNAGVWDEESYQKHERRLPRTLRAQIGYARFRAMTGAPPDSDNIIDNLRACPPGFLAMPLDKLGMTVRQANVMKCHSLERLDHLAPLGVRGLLKLANLGRGSVYGMGQLVFEAFVEGAYINVTEMPAENEGDLQFADHEIGEAEPTTALPEMFQFPAPRKQAQTFTAGFLEALRKLEEKQQAILSARMGFLCKPQTLQEIAGKMGITRERVRQIEHGAYTRLRFDSFWTELQERVDGILLGRSAPILFAGIGALDHWFAGAADIEYTFREVLRNLLPKPVSLYEVAGAMVLTYLPESEWNKAQAEARSLLGANLSNDLGEAHARAMIDSLLVGKGEELRDDLWEIASKGALWVDSRGQQRRLSGFAGSADELVVAILRSSSSPLHAVEIFRRVVAMGYDDHSEIYIRNACRRVGLLFARSIYGLQRHCPLNPQQLIALRAEIDDIIGGFDASKQWHCSELFDALVDRGFAFDGLLTKYIVNIALRDSPHLSYLGRLVWRRRSGTESNNTYARLDVRQAVIALLETHGGPMTTAAIREKLLVGRGLNTHFQIHAEVPIVRIGVGTWGLLGRDAKVEDAKPAIDSLMERLTSLEQGIHITELAEELDLPHLGQEDEAHRFLALARIAGIRIDRSQYIYPAQWKTSRRMSIADAITQTIFEKRPVGATFDHISQRVNALTLREVPRMFLSQILRNVDATFDQSTALWHVAETDETSDEGDEAETASVANLDVHRSAVP